MDTQEKRVDERASWTAHFDSPFSLAAEDLGRFYFFNFWNSENCFPPFEEWHQRIHDTEWFIENDHHCPGRARMYQIWLRLQQEIS